MRLFLVMLLLCVAFASSAFADGGPYRIFVLTDDDGQLDAESRNVIEITPTIWYRFWIDTGGANPHWGPWYKVNTIRADIQAENGRESSMIIEGYIGPVVTSEIGIQFCVAGSSLTSSGDVRQYVSEVEGNRGRYLVVAGPSYYPSPNGYKGFRENFEMDTVFLRLLDRNILGIALQ